MRRLWLLLLMVATLPRAAQSSAFSAPEPASASAPEPVSAPASAPAPEPGSGFGLGPGSVPAPEPVRAPDHAASPHGNSASPLQPRPLNAALDDILRKGEFAWRLPREKKSDEGAAGPIDRFIAWMKRQLIAFREGFVKLVNKIRDWWNRMFPDPEYKPGEAPGFLSGFSLSPRTLLYTLGAVLLGLGLWLWLRARRARRSEPVIGEAYAALTPDLTRDEVTADQLPESGWLALARDLMARGETRLALRALYLASLADLALRGHLTIARAKSNREYQRELRRRARTHENLQAAFIDNMNSFEEVWYGEHPADPARLENFSKNLERMRVDG